MFVITYKLNGVIFLIYIIMMGFGSNPFIINKLAYKKAIYHLKKKKKIVTIIKFILFTTLYFWLKHINITNDVFTLIFVLLDRLFL